MLKSIRIWSNGSFFQSFSIPWWNLSILVPVVLSCYDNATATSLYEHMKFWPLSWTVCLMRIVLAPAPNRLGLNRAKLSLLLFLSLSWGSLTLGHLLEQRDSLAGTVCRDTMLFTQQLTSLPCLAKYKKWVWRSWKDSRNFGTLMLFSFFLFIAFL